MQYVSKIKLSIGALGRPSLPPNPLAKDQIRPKMGEVPPKPLSLLKGANFVPRMGEDPPKPPSLLKEANFVPRMGGGSPQTPL